MIFILSEKVEQSYVKLTISHSDPYSYNPVGYTPAGYDDRRMTQQKPELEETTRTLLERARAVRQNPVWDEEIRFE